MFYRKEFLLMALSFPLVAMEETPDQSHIIQADIYQRSLVYVLGGESQSITDSILPYYINRIAQENIDPKDIEEIILTDRRSSTGISHELKIRMRKALEESFKDVLSHHKEKSHKRKRWLRSSMIANGITAGIATVLILVLQFSQNCN